MIARLLLLTWLLALTLPAGAVIEAYEFEQDELRLRYDRLIEDLRCPKCQNQNLADSDAPIAADLRAEVYRLLNEGHDDTAIEDYLVERYGDFVLYRPRFNQYTASLWLAPALMLLVVTAVIVGLLRRRARQAPADAAGVQRRVDEILQAEDERP